jgi:hypothetical protein
MAPDDGGTRAEAEMVRGRVFGMFADHDSAIHAIRALQAAGFRDSQLGVAMQEERGEPEGEVPAERADATRVAAAGAVGGGVLGGLLGLLSTLLIPGLGAVVAGGVLVGTLTGAGVGAATGGLIAGLMGAGVPEEDARHFDERFRAGGALVTVDAGDRELEAVALLDRHGADLGPTREHAPIADQPG